MLLRKVTPDGLLKPTAVPVCVLAQCPESSGTLRFLRAVCLQPGNLTTFFNSLLTLLVRRPGRERLLDAQPGLPASATACGFVSAGS
jgi:hypothetical protein